MLGFWAFKRKCNNTDRKKLVTCQRFLGQEITVDQKSASLKSNHEQIFYPDFIEFLIINSSSLTWFFWFHVNLLCDSFVHSTQKKRSICIYLVASTYSGLGKLEKRAHPFFGTFWTIYPLTKMANFYFYLVFHCFWVHKDQNRRKIPPFCLSNCKNTFHL